MKKEVLACEIVVGNCMNCQYSDECNWYNDCGDYTPAIVEVEREGEPE